MNEHKRDRVSVDQVLHGYSDGHRLLESSRSFAREAERIMFILSDMSGPAMVKGFESYLTGYPLHDLGVYALAKTWYAPEMDRPGCVWTHTLIIRFSDIPNIKEPRQLLRVFRRPNGKESWSLYRSPVQVPIRDSAGSVDFKLNESRGLVFRVIAALYGSPEKPVFIAAHNSGRFEDLVLRIWSQQWPRLRRSFSFCTGSIANRKLDGRFFDLQIVPKRSLGQIRRELPVAECLDSEKEEDLVTVPSWVSLTANDLLSFDNARLRRFLWNFGADESKGRNVFKRLVEVFLAIEDVDSGVTWISDLIKSVANRFPRKKDGTHLKNAIFGSAAEANNRFLSTVGELDLLKELSITRYHRAFDRKALSIAERAKTLWKSQQEDAKQLIIKLISYDLNPLGEGFLLGISKGVALDDLLELSAEESLLLYALVNRNPSLAESRQIWLLPDAQRRRAIDAIVKSKSVSDRSLKRIVVAMLEAGVSDRAEDVVSLSERCTIGTILDWCDRRGSNACSAPMLPFEWHQSLRLRPSLLLDWLDSSKSASDYSLALLATLLDPHSREVIRFGPDSWLRVLGKSPARVEQDALTHTMGFLLALGFNNAGGRGYELVALAFQVVHDAAERNELELDSWELLADQVPSLFWWRNWDKCERLRIALVEKFVFYNWPAEYFIRAVKREKTFEDILSSIRYSDIGKDLLRKVAEELKRGVAPNNGVHS